MGKNVTVKVKATRRDLENETEVVELVSPGTLHCKNNSYYILYKETALTGMENVATTIKVEGNLVSVIRSGNVSMRQVFEAGKVHSSVYQTPYGSMQMTVKPWNIEVDLTDQGGSINLEYELEMDDTPVGTNRLEIIVQEA